MAHIPTDFFHRMMRYSGPFWTAWSFRRKHYAPTSVAKSSIRGAIKWHIKAFLGTFLQPLLLYNYQNSILRLRLRGHRMP